MSERSQESDKVPEGYKQVQFGPKPLVIPSDWDVERFGDVFERRSESIEVDDGETVRYVGLKHIDSGELEINGHDEDGQERSSSRAFRKGDVLFGKLRPNLKKAAIAPFDGVCSSDIIPIYAEDSTRQRYLPYLMHSNLMRDRVVSTMEGTNLPRTSWSDIKSTLVPLPPLPEQRRIADILSTVDEQIQQTDEIIEETKELKRGLMQDLYKEGAFKHETLHETQCGIVPKVWEICNLGEIAEIVSGSHVKSDLVSSDDSLTPYLTGPDDFTETGFTVTKYTAEPTNFCQEGDTLVTVKGSGCGQSAYAKERACISRQLKAVRPSDDIDSKFLFYYLRSRSDFLNIIAEGTSIPGLSISDLKTLSFPLPSADEQKQIGEILWTVDQRLSDEKKMKQGLQDLKRGLMQDLLTGTVRVDELDLPDE